jgi:hypothetical protein
MFPQQIQQLKERLDELDTRYQECIQQAVINGKKIDLIAEMVREFSAYSAGISIFFSLSAFVCALIFDQLLRH